MESSLGLVLLAVYAATAWPLYRLVRAVERPAWLRAELNVEYLLLLHIALLLTGLAATADGLLG